MNDIFALVAGKSGGHLIPGLTYVSSLIKQQNACDRVLIFATNNALDKTIIEHQSPQDITIESIFLSFGSRAYYRLMHIPTLIIDGVSSLITSIKMLRKNKISRVISMGGAVSIPVCLAARILRIPIELIELNYEPGKAIQFLAPFAQQVNICFLKTRTYFPSKNPANITSIAYPVRFDKKRCHLSISQARTLLGLDPHKPTIALMGGSQGSIFLNTLMKEWVLFNPDFAQTIQVIHLAGNHDLISLQTHYSRYKVNHLVSSYRNDLSPIYQAATLIIGRAGAGSLAEGLFFEKPIIAIPLEANTTTHQKLNAYAYAEQYPDKIVVLEQQHLQMSRFNEHIESFILRYSSSAAISGMVAGVTSNSCSEKSASEAF